MTRSWIRARPQQPRPVSPGPGSYAPVVAGYHNDRLEEVDIAASNTAAREYHGYYGPQPVYYDAQHQAIYYDTQQHAEPHRTIFETHEPLPAELPPQEHTAFIIEHEPEFEPGTGSYDSAYNGGFRPPLPEQPAPKPSMSAQDWPNYRPPVLRWPFLVGLLLVVILLMILAELSVHLLPVDNSTPNLLRRHTVTPSYLSYSSYRPLGDQPITITDSTSNTSATSPSVPTDDPTVTNDLARTAQAVVTSEVERTSPATRAHIDSETDQISTPGATNQYASIGEQSVTATTTTPPPASSAQFESIGIQTVTLGNKRTGTCIVTATSTILLTTTVPVVTVTYGQTARPPSPSGSSFPDYGSHETVTVFFVFFGFFFFGMQTETIGAPDTKSPGVKTTSPSPTQTSDRSTDNPSPSPSPSHKSPEESIIPTRSVTSSHTKEDAEQPTGSARTGHGGLVTVVLSDSQTIVASVPSPKDTVTNTAAHHTVDTATVSKQKPVVIGPTITDTAQGTASKAPDEPVTVVTVSTASDGQVVTRPLTTLTTIFETHHHQTTVSSFSQEGAASGTAGTSSTPEYLVAYLTTLINAEGDPTATYTVIPDPTAVPTTLTLANSAGIHISTLTAEVLEIYLKTMSSGRTQSVSITTRTSAGSTEHRTSTHTSSSSSSSPTTSTDITGSTTGNQNSNGTVLVYYISEQQYFTAAFLPTLLATQHTIPNRILDLTAKKFAPFRALAQAEGVAAADSLWLPTGGVTGLLVGLHSPLVLLTSQQKHHTTELIPLSASAVGFAYHGACHEGGMSIANCARTLAVFPVGARAVGALLAVVALLTAAVLAVSVRWRSGVAADPWSIAAMAALGTHDDVAALVRGRPPLDRRKVRERGVVVALQPFERPDRAGGDEWGYGIVVLSRSAERLRKRGRRVSFADEKRRGWGWLGVSVVVGWCCF